MSDGHRAFPCAKTIEVALADGGTRVLRGKNVVISTGSRATMEEIPGLAEAQPLTHIEALDLDHIPGHLLILGGGYIGLEFARRPCAVSAATLLSLTETHNWPIAKIRT